MTARDSIPTEEQWKRIEKWGIKIPEGGHNFPNIWHGWLGAELARRKYALDPSDEEIASAIYWHSTGRPGMTPLEQIAFIADSIEPMRDYEGVDELRRLARERTCAAR